MDLSTYELDIHNYSTEELYSLIGIHASDQPTAAAVVAAVRAKVCAAANSEELCDFFREVEDEILDAMQRKHDEFVLESKLVMVDKSSRAGNLDQNNPVAGTHEYKYIKGSVNPLEKQTITKLISIDSVFRKNYERSMSTDFIWSLPGTEPNVVALRLACVELPIMWYTISEKNNSNFFKLNTYNIKDVPDAEYLIEIPSGNYNAGQITTAINNAMQNLGIVNLQFEINKLNGKSIFRLKAEHDLPNDNTPDISDPTEAAFSPDFYYELDFSVDADAYVNKCYKNKSNLFHLSSSLGLFLGFTCPMYTVMMDTTISTAIYHVPDVPYYGYIQSDRSYGNGRSNYLYVSVNDYVKNSVVNTVVTGGPDVHLGDDILGRISINESANTIMLNNGNDCIYKQRDYLGPVSLNNLHIRILNKFGEVIDLNNNDVSLAFEITVLY
jgi:hypothetical protein